VIIGRRLYNFCGVITISIPKWYMFLPSKKPSHDREIDI